MAQPRRRRRRRRRGGGQPTGSREQGPSYDELVGGAAKERPAALTAPPDGQTLEDLIGDLQSHWGVPQYPQEFRITLKVAAEGEARTPVAVERDERPRNGKPSGDAAASEGGRRREKAPAAPRVAAGASGDTTRTREPAAPRKRRRGRRRRGRGGAAGETGGAAEPRPGAPGEQGVEGGDSG